MAEQKASLTEDISAYEAMQNRLERDHFGEWVVVHDKRLASVHPSFGSAAEFAVAHFGRGPYLIRQVGAGPVSLPASVLCRPVSGHVTG